MLNIDELIKESLKNKKTMDLKVYRILKSDIMAFKTQKNAPVYDEAAELKIIQKYVTKMEDAEKQYLVQNEVTNSTKYEDLSHSRVFFC